MTCKLVRIISVVVTFRSSFLLSWTVSEICNKSNTTVASSETGFAYPSEMLVVFVFCIFSNYLFSRSLLCVVRSATISADQRCSLRLCFRLIRRWFIDYCCLTSSGRYFMHIPERGKWLIFYKHFFYLFTYTIVKNDYHMRWC
jgi:hypothetical protein